MRFSIIGDEEEVGFAAPIVIEDTEPATDPVESSGDLAIPGKEADDLAHLQSTIYFSETTTET